jgi:hypothetical protein
LSFAEYIWAKRPDQVIAGHAELVHNLFVKSEKVPSLRQKAKWLLEYHNNHVQSRKGLDSLIVRLAPPIMPDNNEKDPEPQTTAEDLALRHNALRTVEAFPPGRLFAIDEYSDT